MPTLSDSQRLLWRLIAAPEGVASTLDADGDRGGGLTAALARTVRGDGRLAAIERLDIYANMYFFRVLDVLKEDYPGVLALLGEVAFHNLITDYLLRHPPAHFSIREAGRHLPEFLTSHAAVADHPCVADLGRYERALNDAFDAADAPALQAAALADLAPQAWSELGLTLHPSVRLLECAWPVDALRSAVDSGDAASDPTAEDSCICVWRQDLIVFHRRIDRVQLAALRAVERGESFGAVCASAGDALGEEDAPQRVAVALSGWLANGWLANI